MSLVRVPVALALTLLWVLLWGEPTPWVITGGLVVSFGVVIFFPFPRVDVHPVVRPWQLVVLFAVFFWDMFIASLQVGWLAIRRKPLPPAALIEAPLITGSDLLQTITAELICLVPGSLLIELDDKGKRMWLHVIDVDSPESLAKARRMAREQEYRVLAALGSPQEYAAAKARRKELDS